MAAIVNARDLLIEQANPRTLSVPLPSNLVIPSENVDGLTDIYNSTKQIILNASSLLFQIPKTGATLPTSISMTAVLKNIVGTVQFSVIAGSCTWAANGNTITILPNQLSSTSATIRASVVADDGNTYSDVVTIAKVAEGVDSVVGLLSNESAVISTPFDGTITDYSAANGTFYVFDGLTNMTGNAAVSYSVVNPSPNLTIALKPDGTYTVSGIGSDTATAILRAVYKGVTIDKIYTLAKSRAGATAQLVTISADSQVFKIAKDGITVSPQSINISAAANGLNGTPVFQVVSGSVTSLTGTGSSRVLSFSNMASDSATISVTWDGKTDSITIVKVREGVDSLTGFLTNESAMVPADASGNLTGSLSQMGGTFKVFLGINDITGSAGTQVTGTVTNTTYVSAFDAQRINSNAVFDATTTQTTTTSQGTTTTINAVTYSIQNKTNMDGTIGTNGVYTITSITADSGSITFRATVNGVNIDKVYSLAKAKTGPKGADGGSGSRGNVNIAYAISGSAWADNSAVAAIANAGYGTPINRDIVTLYNTATGFSQARFYNAGSWLTLDAYVNGNMLVTGTVSTAALAAGAITADKMAIGNGKNILWNSAPSPRGVFGWAKGYQNSPVSIADPWIATDWAPAGCVSLGICLNGTVGAGYVFSMQHDNYGRRFACKPQQRYEASAYISAHRCNAYILIEFWDAAGTYLGVGDTRSLNVIYDNHTGPGGKISDYPRAWAYANAPVNAATMMYSVRAEANSVAAQSAPYIFSFQHYLGEASTYQTVLSPWTEGGQTTISGSQIDTPNLSAITANLGYITAGQIHGGNMHGGAYSGYAWPPNGAGGGFYIGPEGALFGNPNQPGMGYFQIAADGGVYAPHFYMKPNGEAFFDGTLRANIVDTNQLVDRSVTGTVTCDFYIGPSASVWYMNPFQFYVPQQSFAHIFVELVGWPGSDQNQTVQCGAWVKRYGEQTYYPNLSDAKLSVNTVVAQSQPASQPFMNRLDPGTWYINSWLQTGDYMHDLTVRIYIYFIKK